MEKKHWTPFPYDWLAGSGLRRRRRARSSMRKRAMHLSNNIVCYEQRTDCSDGQNEQQEPINKIRRLGSPGKIMGELHYPLCWFIILVVIYIKLYCVILLYRYVRLFFFSYDFSYVMFLSFLILFIYFFFLVYNLYLVG